MTDTDLADRDVIDVANPAEQHLADCRELALARCPELTPADLGGAFRGDSPALEIQPTMMLRHRRARA